MRARRPDTDPPAQRERCCQHRRRHRPGRAFSRASTRAGTSPKELRVAHATKCSAVFAVLTAAQVRALPARGAPATPGTPTSIAGQWRAVARRPFLLFAAVMTCSYVLSFQVYLALPLEVRRLGGDTQLSTVGVGALFAASGLLTILAQNRVTAWCRTRLQPAGAVTLGLAVMAAAFLPLLAATALPAPTAWWALAARAVLPAVLPAVLTALLLAVGTIIAYPFEMDLIVTLSQERLVATHYGLYNTICGIGITAGTLLTGVALDTARAAGLPALPWLALIALGAASATALRSLHRRGQLSASAAIGVTA